MSSNMIVFNNFSPAYVSRIKKRIRIYHVFLLSQIAFKYSDGGTHDYWEALLHYFINDEYLEVSFFSNKQTMCIKFIELVFNVYIIHKNNASSIIRKASLQLHNWHQDYWPINLFGTYNSLFYLNIYVVIRLAVYSSNYACKVQTLLAL